MKKIVAVLLMICVSGMMLIGCNSGESGTVADDNVDAAVNAESELYEEAVTEASEVADEEVSEEVPEITIEEKIASWMPAKSELGEDEIYTPEPVTAEMIMAKMEEITVTEGEWAEDINRENLAGLLVLNASCMDSAEFNQLVTENFGDVDNMMQNYLNYAGYLYDKNEIYGQGDSVLPEELIFDSYLKNQAEQISCMIQMYQNDTENSKVYYDILINYLYNDQNDYFTFDNNDS